SPRRFIADECPDLLRRGRQSGEVEISPANQLFPAGLRIQSHFAGFEPGQDKRINGSTDLIAMRYPGRRPLHRFLIGPKFLAVTARRFGRWELSLLNPFPYETLFR